MEDIQNPTDPPGGRPSTMVKLEPDTISTINLANFQHNSFENPIDLDASDNENGTPIGAGDPIVSLSAEDAAGGEDPIGARSAEVGSSTDPIDDVSAEVPTPINDSSAEVQHGMYPQTHIAGEEEEAGIFISDDEGRMPPVQVAQDEAEERLKKRLRDINRKKKHVRFMDPDEHFDLERRAQESKAGRASKHTETTDSLGLSGRFDDMFLDDVQDGTEFQAPVANMGSGQASSSGSAAHGSNLGTMCRLQVPQKQFVHSGAERAMKRATNKAWWDGLSEEEKRKKRLQYSKKRPAPVQAQAQAPAFALTPTTLILPPSDLPSDPTETRKFILILQTNPKDRTEEEKRYLKNERSKISIRKRKVREQLAVQKEIASTYSNALNRPSSSSSSSSSSSIPVASSAASARSTENPNSSSTSMLYNGLWTDSALQARTSGGNEGINANHPDLARLVSFDQQQRNLLHHSSQSPRRAQQTIKLNKGRWELEKPDDGDMRQQLTPDLPGKVPDIVSMRGRGKQPNPSGGGPSTTDSICGELFSEAKNHRPHAPVSTPDAGGIIRGEPEAKRRKLDQDTSASNELVEPLRGLKLRVQIARREEEARRQRSASKLAPTSSSTSKVVPSADDKTVLNADLPKINQATSSFIPRPSTRPLVEQKLLHNAVLSHINPPKDLSIRKRHLPTIAGLSVSPEPESEIEDVSDTDIESVVEVSQERRPKYHYNYMVHFTYLRDDKLVRFKKHGPYLSLEEANKQAKQLIKDQERPGGESLQRFTEQNKISFTLGDDHWQADVHRELVKDKVQAPIVYPTELYSVQIRMELLGDGPEIERLITHRGSRFTQYIIEFHRDRKLANAAAVKEWLRFMKTSLIHEYMASGHSFEEAEGSAHVRDGLNGQASDLGRQVYKLGKHVDSLWAKEYDHSHEKQGMLLIDGRLITQVFGLKLDPPTSVASQIHRNGYPDLADEAASEVTTSEASDGSEQGDFPETQVSGGSRGLSTSHTHSFEQSNTAKQDGTELEGVEEYNEKAESNDIESMDQMDADMALEGPGEEPAVEDDDNRVLIREKITVFVDHAYIRFPLN